MSKRPKQGELPEQPKSFTGLRKSLRNNRPGTKKPLLDDYDKRLAEKRAQLLSQQLSDKEFRDIDKLQKQLTTRRNIVVQNWTHWLRIAVAFFFHLVVISFLFYYASSIVMGYLPESWNIIKLDSQNIDDVVISTLPFILLAAAVITFQGIPRTITNIAKRLTDD